MKVYDCFTFFNELDLLEIRLQELWDSVDCFVLAEANLSHSGNPKDYIFENNKERFKPYLSKIRHIKINDMPTGADSWTRERFQRRCLSRGLYDLESDDLVITSDLDEITRPEMIDVIKNDNNDYSRYILGIPLFRYKINYMLIHPLHKVYNIIVTRGRVFTDNQREREFTFPWVPTPNDAVYVEHGGWHFSYFGDNDNAINKIKNFAHTETNVPEIVDNHDIDYFIEHKSNHHGPSHPERHEYIIVDDYFPKCITSNLDYWKEKNMIIPNATAHVEDIYKFTI